MDNQDQRRTHTQGHENHGVHMCHNCGWPFPNPHPSAKHRRAHKKICGTIEGYTLLFSEGQTHFNPSDDEHLSDDDHKRQGPKALDTGGNNEKGSGGIGENSIRSVDEVFSDAVADFSDGALSPGVKEPLRDSLDSATDLEIIHRTYPEFSGSSEDNGSNDENQLIVKSRNDGQIQNPKIVRSEKVEDGNMLELQGQLSSSTVYQLSSSIADLKTEEFTVVPTNDCFDLTSDSKPSKSEAMLDVLLDNKIYAGENVRACSLTSVAKETILKEKDEIISDENMVKIVVSSNNTKGETFEGVSKIAASDVVNSNPQVADGASNLKGKNNVEFPSMMPHNDLPLEVDSAVSTNAFMSGIRVESADMIELATSGDFKTLQEREEGNVHVLSHPSCDARPVVAHPHSDYENCHINKDYERVVSQDSSSLHSSKALEQELNDLKDSDIEENDFLINLSQSSEKREVFAQDMHALSSNMTKLMAEESIEVSPVMFRVESSRRLDENGASMNAMKTEMNENHVVHFSEEQGSDDVCKNSQQVNLPEGCCMAASNENPSDASFGSAASETTIVISRDNRSHQEKNIGMSDIAVGGKCRGSNSGNYTGISMKTLLPSSLHLKINPSSLYKCEDAIEMGNFEKCDIKDTQYTERPFAKDNPLPATSHFESPILSEVVMDGSARTRERIECTNRSPLPGAQEDIKDYEIISNDRLNEDSDRIASIAADSHQARDGEPLLKATEGLDRDHSLLSSLNIEPSAQHISAAEVTQDGKPGREVTGVVADPIQDQNVLSVQPHAQGVINLEALPSTDLLATEAGKSNLKEPTAASERQQCENTEMFEPPSFMTLVEPGHVVGAKPAASEVQIELNKQHPDLTSLEAVWFPTLTHVNNESQGRKRNEEIIAKVTKQNTPLKSLLSEAANGKRPKSPILEKNSVNQKNSKVAEDNGSGLTTVNPILGRESPAVQVVKGESATEWNSPASYPADIKREKKKAKIRPYWMQFLCCSSVDTK